MLKTTKKIKEIYEDIQKKIFYMIPEKWDELYLYASVIERFGSIETGELFFYYIPKGILRKNPINVYEIPAKFNLEEAEYLRLVDLLYSKIKELREEFKKIENELPEVFSCRADAKTGSPPTLRSRRQLYEKRWCRKLY